LIITLNIRLVLLNRSIKLVIFTRRSLAREKNAVPPDRRSVLFLVSTKRTEG